MRSGILSTGQSVRSTGQSTKSNFAGKQESTEMTDGNPHPKVSSSNPGAHPCKPEYVERVEGDGGPEGGRWQGELGCNDAACEKVDKHPAGNHGNKP